MTASQSESVRINSIAFNRISRTEAQVLGNSFDFVIDTGAPVEVLDEWSFNQLETKPRLEACSIKFYGHTASTCIPILGQFTTSIQAIGRIVNATFVNVTLCKALITFKLIKTLKCTANTSVVFNS